MLELNILTYYRPQTDKSLEALSDILDDLTFMYPNDHILLVGVMNMPGNDWHEHKLKPLVRDHKINNDFLKIINQHLLHPNPCSR